MTGSYSLGRIKQATDGLHNRANPKYCRPRRRIFMLARGVSVALGTIDLHERD